MKFERRSEVSGAERKKGPDEAMAEAVLYGEKVGAGRDALVFRLDLNELDEPVREVLREEGVEREGQERTALKVLKVYQPGRGVKEYTIQRQAYEIVREMPEAAKVPEPSTLKDSHIDDRTRQYLNGQGAHLGGDMEVVVMEFIPGKDMATLMYEFVLQKMGFSPEFLGQMSFEDKNAAVAARLGFSEGKATNRSEGAAQFAEVMAMNENGKKLSHFLRQNGFVIAPEVITKVENALKAFKASDIHHNDMHERNVMIREDGEVFIIDFGRSEAASSDTLTDDFAMVRRWKEIATSPEEEARLRREQRDRDVQRLIARLEQSPKWKERIAGIESSLAAGNASALDREFVKSQGRDSEFEQLLGAFQGIAVRKPELKAGVVATLERFLESRSPRPFELAKVKELLHGWQE